MKKVYVFIILIVVLLILVFTSDSWKPNKAGEKAAAPFTDGERIRIVVPYSAGGGYDIEARLFAPYLKEKIAEKYNANVNIIVDNVTGGGTSIATIEVYNAPSDGKTLFFMDVGAAATQQVLLDAKFDVREFKYVGQQSVALFMFLAAKNMLDETPTFSDMVKRSQNKPLLLATDGSGGYGHIVSALFELALRDQGIDLYFDYIHFAGVAEIDTSIRRGETEVRLGGIEAFYTLWKQGGIEPLFTIQAERSPDFPDIKSLFEEPMLEKLKDVKAIKDITDISAFRRVWTLPPGTDESAVKLYNEMVTEIMKDPKFIEEMKSVGRTIYHLDGEKMLDVTMGIYSVLDQYKEKLKPLLKK